MNRCFSCNAPVQRDEYYCSDCIKTGKYSYKGAIPTPPVPEADSEDAKVGTLPILANPTLFKFGTWTIYICCGVFLFFLLREEQNRQTGIALALFGVYAGVIMRLCGHTDLTTDRLGAVIIGGSLASILYFLVLFRTWIDTRLGLLNNFELMQDKQIGIGLGVAGVFVGLVLICFKPALNLPGDPKI